MRLALETAARLVRVDDHVGVGQRDRRDRGRWWSVTSTCRPERVGCGDAFDAGDAVVDGDQQRRRRAPCTRCDDRRRQAVAVRPRGRAPGSRTCWRAPSSAQAAQRRRRRRWRRRSRSRRRCRAAGRRAIASASSARGFAAPFIPAGGSRRARPSSSSSVAAHAARRVQARQQRMHAGLLERPGGARRNVAGDDLHSALAAGPLRACRLNRPPMRLRSRPRRPARRSAARCARRTGSA